MQQQLESATGWPIRRRHPAVPVHFPGALGARQESTAVAPVVAAQVAVEVQQAVGPAAEQARCLLRTLAQQRMHQAAAAAAALQPRPHRAAQLRGCALQTAAARACSCPCLRVWHQRLRKPADLAELG